MEKGLDESNAANMKKSYELSQAKLEQGVQIAREALTNSNTTAAKAALANRLLGLGTLLSRQQDALVIEKHGMEVATECLQLAKDTHTDPLRLIQCHALLAKMISSAGLSEGEPDGIAMFGTWSEVETFVQVYTPADKYAPPPESLLQRLLTEKANAAEFCKGDTAMADALRIQACKTAPRMNPRPVFDAATALSKRGTTEEVREYGTTVVDSF